MNVLVYGAGAVGSLFAARLAAAGHAVTIVGRASHVAAIRASGLEVQGVRPGRFSFSALEKLEAGASFDAVLLGVKTFDLQRAAHAVARSLGSPVPTLVPQNGLDVETHALRGLSEGGWTGAGATLVRCVHSIPATLVGPGVVRQAGDGEVLLPAAAAPPVPAVETWAALLGTMGYPLRRLTDFLREVWRKAILNAAINPVTADHRVLNGQLRDDPWRGQALELLREARMVAEAEGIRFAADELEADLWRVVQATATNRSSMLQDVERGRPTEVEEISGQLLVLGERHRLDLPATRRAVARIRSRSARRHRASTSFGPPTQAS